MRILNKLLLYTIITVLSMIIISKFKSLILLDFLILIVIIVAFFIKILLTNDDEIIIDFKSNRISIDKNRENPPKVQCPKCGEFVYLELEVCPDRPGVTYIGECCNRRIVIPMTDYECMKINDFIIETIDE